MKVNKMGLATVIRKIVRDEVDKVLTERITTVLENIDTKTIMSANTPVTSKRAKTPTPNPKNTTLRASAGPYILLIRSVTKNANG